MNPCGETTSKWDKYTLNNNKYSGVHEWAKPKQNLHLSFSPTFFFFFFLIFLSLVMEAIDSWLTLFFFFLCSISLYFSPLPCCVLGLCLSVEYLAIKHIKQRDKIRKIKPSDKTTHAFSLFRLKVFKNKSVNLSVHNKQTWKETSTFAILTLRMSFCQTQAAQLSFFI